MTDQRDEPETAEEGGSEATLTGVALIRARLPQLPEGPGVYRMFAASGDVLYVGKARSLKRRVASYARFAGHTQRIARMLSETRAFEIITTRTEIEALLLEANLIKTLKPRYNVTLRDDKSYPYILLRTDHAFPQVIKHRGALDTAGHYFGPFASAGAVNRTLNTLQRAFLLRSCSDSVFEGRTRPCLLHQIKRCSAPCVGFIEAPAYGQLVADAKDFLTGKSDSVRSDLTRAMAEASARLDFEHAAALRDRIRALSHVESDQGINPRGVEEADVVAIHAEGGASCVQVFFFRSGQNWGNRSFFPRHDASVDASDVLEAFLAQFYDDKPVPPLVLASHDFEGRALLEEALSTRAGRRVEVAVPQRGEKRALVEHALENAREALGRRLAEGQTQRKLLLAVAELFGLEDAPNRIEIYDNSHIQGSNPVGAMVVAGPEGFEKGQYRKFNIKSETLSPGDDFAMMREVLRRRFARLRKEEEEGINPPQPDLVLIDGGEGQRRAAADVLTELGINDIALVAISKGPDRNAGREQFHRAGHAPFLLEPRSPVLYYLQRLRDEAHRFAIGSHRARRSRDIRRSPLDEIPGIGPARKRALLHHFGSARGVERAALADLERVEGIDKSMAQRIFAFFRDGS